MTERNGEAIKSEKGWNIMYKNKTNYFVAFFGFRGGVTVLFCETEL